MATVVFRDELSSEQEKVFLESKKVSDWMTAITRNFRVQSVVFEKVYFFGPKVGFVLADAKAFDEQNRQIPGIALIRGDSVAVLPLLVTPDGEEYTVLTRQPRLPAGSSDFLEIPAGMLDEGVFVSKAIEEIEEEVGADLSLSAEDLVPVTTFHTSPGCTDERIATFYAVKEVSADFVTKLHGRETGNRDDKEAITVEVIPLHELPEKTAGDAKSLVAYYGMMAERQRVASPLPEALNRSYEDALRHKI